MPNNEGTILQALDAGYTPDAIEREMIGQGVERDNAIQSIKGAINNKGSGLYDTHSFDEVRTFFKEKGFSDTYIPEMRADQVDFNEAPQSKEQAEAELGAISKELKRDRSIEQATVKEVDPVDFNDINKLHARFENIAFKYNTVDQVEAFFGDEGKLESLEIEQGEVQQFIAHGLLKEGVDVIKVIETNEGLVEIDSTDPRFANIYKNSSLAARDEQGQIKEINSGFLQSLSVQKAEIGGAIGGSIAGGSAVGALVSKLPIPPIFKGALIAGGAFGGSLAGSSVGRGVDIIINAHAVNQELETRKVAAQMIDAGYTDAIFALGGGAALKVTKPVAKVAFNALKGAPAAIKATPGAVVKGVTNTVDTVKSIPPTLNKAKTVLSRYMPEDQQDLIIREWEKLNGLKAGSITKEEALGIITTTEPILATSVKGVSSKAHAISANLVTQVNKRAKDILGQIDKAKSPNLTRIVVEDMDNYISGVKALYTDTTLKGSQVLKDIPFKFDYDGIITDNLAKKLRSKITNPEVAGLIEQHMVNAGKLSSRRDFKSMLDTRKVMLDLKHGISQIDVGNAKVIDETIQSLDKEIKSVANKTPEGKAWFKAFEEAKISYGQMIDFKKNALFKALTRDGVNPDEQIKAFQKYITAEDGTFVELTHRLPVSTKKKVEAEVLDGLVNSHTIGDAAGAQAIDFPELAKTLDKYPFRFKEQKDLKRVINMMSKVYRADPDLAVLSGRISLDNSRTAIAQTIVGRAKQEFIQSSYSYLGQFKPTKGGAESTLLNKLAKVLDNPLDQKSVEQLLKELPGEDVAQRVKDLQITMVKEGKRIKPDIPRTEIFKPARLGEEFKVKDGPLGRGIYYKAEKRTAKKAVDEPLKRVVTRRVADFSIAPDSVIQQVLGKNEITKENLKRFNIQIKNHLQDLDYVGYRFGDDVLIFE